MRAMKETSASGTHYADSASPKRPDWCHPRGGAAGALNSTTASVLTTAVPGSAHHSDVADATTAIELKNAAVT